MGSATVIHLEHKDHVKDLSKVLDTSRSVRSSSSSSWIRLVCSDGEVVAPRMRLILFSPLITELLSSSTSAEDNIKTIILPDFTVHSVRTFISLLDDGTAHINQKQGHVELRSVIDVAQSLGLKHFNNFSFGNIKRNVVQIVTNSDESFVSKASIASDNDEKKKSSTLRKIVARRKFVRSESLSNSNNKSVNDVDKVIYQVDNSSKGKGCNDTVNNNNNKVRNQIYKPVIVEKKQGLALVKQISGHGCIFSCLGCTQLFQDFATLLKHVTQAHPLLRYKP